MKKHLKFAGKAAAFLCLLTAAVLLVNKTLVPKYLMDAVNPVTLTFDGVYDLEEDSLDVLFMGSSHTGAGFIPQRLYNEFGLRSYNLGSNSQGLWITYHWLKEVLKTQSPQAVVLDCYMLFVDSSKEETQARVSMDYMKFGKNKIEAVNAVCRLDPSQSRLSYYLPNIRYHSRWTALEENDFAWTNFQTPSTKGYWLYRDICNDRDYAPFTATDPSKTEEFLPVALEYLERIRTLCQQENIRLVLTKTPTLAQTEGRHNAVKQYAQKHGLPFYDFNEKTLYDQLDFDYALDMHDSETTGKMNAHANPSGAGKMTDYLGEKLTRDLGVTGGEDPQWEKTRYVQEMITRDFALHNTPDGAAYLQLCKEGDYTLFFAAQGDVSPAITPDMRAALDSLGLKTQWIDAPGASYCAVLSKGELLMERYDGETVSYQSSMREGRTLYELTSPKNDSSKCSITIGGKERAMQKNGLNIVVYSNELNRVIDSAHLQTPTEKSPGTVAHK